MITLNNNLSSDYSIKQTIKIMIIFGSSSEKVKASVALYPSVCPHCESKNTMLAEVLMRYFHIWYIPFFPIGKSVIATCSHCKGVYQGETMPNNLGSECIELKNNTKYPLTYWSFTFIILALFVFVIVVSKR